MVRRSGRYSVNWRGIRELAASPPPDEDKEEKPGDDLNNPEVVFLKSIVESPGFERKSLLPNDMENYMEYHVMGSVSQVRMKPACMPSKFQCQPDRRKRTFNATKRPYILKKQRLTLIKECEKDLEERSVTTKQVEVGESSSGISGYGGRITDTCLVEQCDFIRCLQPGMYVMADRGFKHVEQYLRKEECS
ncbi:hypothetical protein EVAR_28161_1 [Eumeta japonica]|uniref:DDE Tnp4 domain-containing protein n=1 Tax=Eumeta variegata TaxID=151549 RepID=A0A4C1VE48_EUMVA|nr:hypothetical protein EVAR_28161_1 [Eumeta japonica]